MQPTAAPLSRSRGWGRGCSPPPARSWRAESVTQVGMEGRCARLTGTLNVSRSGATSAKAGGCNSRGKESDPCRVIRRCRRWRPPGPCARIATEIARLGRQPLWLAIDAASTSRRMSLRAGPPRPPRPHETKVGQPAMGELIRLCFSQRRRGSPLAEVRKKQGNSLQYAIALHRVHREHDQLGLTGASHAGRLSAHSPDRGEAV